MEMVGSNIKSCATVNYWGLFKDYSSFWFCFREIPILADLEIFLLFVKFQVRWNLHWWESLPIHNTKKFFKIQKCYFKNNQTTVFSYIYIKCMSVCCFSGNYAHILHLLPSPSRSLYASTEVEIELTMEIWSGVSENILRNYFQECSDSEEKATFSYQEHVSSSRTSIQKHDPFSVPSNDILLFQGQSNTLDLFHSQSLPHQSPIVAPKVFSTVRGLVSADGSCR